MPRTTSLPSSPLLGASGAYARPRALLSRSRTLTPPMREIPEPSKTQAARFLYPRWENIPMQYVISSDSKLGSQSNSPTQHPQNTHPSLLRYFQSSILQPPEWPLLSRARIAHNCSPRAGARYITYLPPSTPSLQTLASSTALCLPICT
jgi:hypothetical protein